ncbi:HHL225Cp [Eremothecium sinecaudum]|uniref:HHL225Cp n=1 Tax=Eremothecium sinecaudum TaxID=45286 RepID=A0A120K2T6_9SACH|nr:HHL225Cp [Eremothecium sinecaudum]AMD22545.1 HHL225Cp [Eremothecium sinecaudum]
MNSNLKASKTLLLNYLKDIGLINNLNHATVKDESKKSAILSIKIDEEKANELLRKPLDNVEVIFIDMSSGKKVMINICNNDKPIKEGIFDYTADLNIPTNAPENEEDLIAASGSQASQAFQSKFSLSSTMQSSPLQESTQESTHTAQSSKLQEEPKVSVRPELPRPEFPEPLSTPSNFEDRFKIPGSGNDFNEQPFPANPRRPADMPDFEDEYEIQSGLRNDLGGHPFPTNPGSYGNSDLYPTGEKYPSLNPNPGLKPAGGMFFKPPSQPELPLPYGGSFDPQNPQDFRKPPGFTPGARWNNPFGPHNFGNHP